MPERKIEIKFTGDFPGFANTKPSPDVRGSKLQRRRARGEEYKYSGPVKLCEPAKKGEVRKLPESVVRTLRGAGRVEFGSDELALVAKQRAEKEAKSAERLAR